MIGIANNYYEPSKLLYVQNSTSNFTVSFAAFFCCWQLKKCCYLNVQASRKLGITEVDLSRAEAGLEAAEA